VEYQDYDIVTGMGKPIDVDLALCEEPGTP